MSAAGEAAGVKGLPCWRTPDPPSLTPLPSSCPGPPNPPLQVQPTTSSRKAPDPPEPPGLLLLEGATPGAEVSPPPWGPSASGALTAGGMWVTEVTVIVRAPGVTVALGSGGSVWF